MDGGSNFEKLNGSDLYPQTSPLFIFKMGHVPGGSEGSSSSVCHLPSSREQQTKSSPAHLPGGQSFARCRRFRVRAGPSAASSQVSPERPPVWQARSAGSAVALARQPLWTGLPHPRGTARGDHSAFSTVQWTSTWTSAVPPAPPGPPGPSPSGPTTHLWLSSAHVGMYRQRSGVQNCERVTCRSEPGGQVLMNPRTDPSPGDPQALPPDVSRPN
jgi:hypothetical protein